jgi:hypothetical protein
MSGRSAYVRKKITQTKSEGKAAARGPPKSAGSSAEHDDLSIPELFPVPPGMAKGPVGTGIGTTNARFLKFSEAMRDTDQNPNYGNMSSPSVGSQSGGSTDSRRDGMVVPSHLQAPLEGFAYARARKPTIKTEDVSGIEKSGLRSIIDKKSEDVRKGLAKTFNFRKKEKQDERRGSAESRQTDYRPQSSATVRPNAFVASPIHELDHNEAQTYNIDQMQMQYQSSQTGELWDSGSIMSPPPAGKLPPVPQAPVTPPIKRWIGAGRPVQRWNKLRKDPELWDPNGDVLVFFGHKGQSPRPNPSFRLSSHIIEATESRYLITLLREGSTEEDIHMPPSPAGAPPMLRAHDIRAANQYLGHGLGRGGQPTPPISEDASLGEADGQISYEMYFPTPSNMTKVEQLRNHITTRNVFALLYHASLVGLSLYQALSDLHSRLEQYMPPDSSDNVGMILNYLSARGIDDVRNEPETAVSILAWSESPDVRWEEGWRESFVHCAGMYGQLERCDDFKNVTPITRALLDRACLETQLRVQSAEERLVEFQYEDMWPTTGQIVNSSAKAAADRLQKFFLGHYSRVYGCWPPATAAHLMSSPQESPGGSEAQDGDEWLTRTVAQSLQKEFGALYDYLVNRDVIWDGSEARSSRKWMMVSDTGNKLFEADLSDLPMTDMLIEFDNKLRFPHIPHPYPLVPESIPPTSSSLVGRESSSMFKTSTLKKNGNGNGGAGRSGALERRIQLAYTEATNIYVLGSDFTQCDLIDAFVKFEKSDQVGEIDPAVARRGRWVLVYGILQTLASVSVDAPNVRYKDDVPYHLSPRLRGTKMPPWRSGPSPGFSNTPIREVGDEATHELSHCWIVQRTWNSAQNSSGAESSGGSGNTSPVIGNTGASRTASYTRAPPSVITSTSRASAMGYHTPAARSVRSSGSVPPFSSAASVVSESDNSSSIRTPASRPGSRPGSNMRRVRSRDNMASLKAGGGGLGGGPGSLRSAQTFGGFDRVDEIEYPVRKRDFSVAGDDNSSTYGGYARSTSSSKLQHPLPLPGSITGTGGFLALDDMVESRRGSFSTAVSGRYGSGGRVNFGAGSETDSVAPVIRDFDELDVIDDTEP